MSASCVSLPVQTNSAGEKQIIFTAETLENVEADHTMAVDVARATVRRGYPELQFAQVDPCDDRRLVRLVTARFSPERFVEIAAGNEQVLKQTEQILDQLPHLRASVEGPALFDGFRSDTVPTLLLDSDAALISFVDLKAGVLLLSLGVHQRLVLSRQPKGHVTVKADVQITMTTPTLVELLLTWKDVASKVMP